MFTRISFVKFALAVAGISLIPVASAQQPATRRYTTKFEVSITKRAHAFQSPFQIIGELAIDLAADGSFTCEITPLKDVPDGRSPESVLIVGGRVAADGPLKLPCSGQVSGRLVGITIDVSENFKIYGTGVLPGDLSRLAPGPINMAFGGTASTSVAGEMGDWATGCVRVKLFNPFTGELIFDVIVCVTITPRT